MTRSWSRRERLCGALASLAYVATSLFVLRAVVPDPMRLLPYNTGIDAASRQIGHFDQSMVVSVITRNANLLVTEPWNLLGDGQCFPFPHSFTLGEHMFGEGVQMALPWLLTSDPILSYNLLLLLALSVSGISMYLLAHHFTRDPAASFLAGLLMLLAPSRIIDGGHPYLHAEFWLPLILLFLHKLFTEEARMRNAAWLGLFAALQCLETIYVVIACGIVGGVYGLHLLLRFPRRLSRVLLPLLASLGFAAIVAWLVLSPYFETRENWLVLGGRQTTLFSLRSYWLGTPFFIGLIAVPLVIIALADRLLHRRGIARDDPRLALLAAGLAIIWASVNHIPLPGTDFSIPGLFPLLVDVMPGLDSVRAFFVVTIGLTVPAALLCGYGAHVLLRRLRKPAAIGFTALLSLAILAERFVPSVAAWNFGTRLDLAGWDARPPESDIELIRSATQGPTFDAPIPIPSYSIKSMAVSRHLLLQSWNPTPSSSCYNSYQSPLADQIYQLGTELPNASAAEALAALGFETVLSHTRAWWPPHWVEWQTRVADDPKIQRVMRKSAESPGLTAYRLHPQAPVQEDLTRLVGRQEGNPVAIEVREDGGTLQIPFVFRNPGPATFRHPPPFARRQAILTWQSGGHPAAPPQRVSILWPIALGPGATMEVEVPSRGDFAPGLYQVSLSSTAHPDSPVATREVLLLPSSTDEPA